jgi:hypothetical protein
VTELIHPIAATPQHWRKTETGWVVVPGFRIPSEFVDMTIDVMAHELGKHHARALFTDLRQYLSEWRWLVAQQQQAFDVVVSRYERLSKRDHQLPEDRRDGYWMTVCIRAKTVANELPTSEMQDLARHYAIQSAFRAHDGKRAWELSKVWGMTNAATDT